MAVFLAALCVYVLTLSPSIGWGDSAELTTAAWQAGVPHPTGYPLYMLLGHAFLKLVPFGSVAYRMNLLSAICGALAAAGLYLAARRACRSSLAGGIAALAFAFSLTFWSQCVVAEVYAAHMLFNAAVLAAVLRWDQTGSPAVLRLAALLYGLSFTHHLMSVLAAPALLYLAATSGHRRALVRDLPRLLPLFLAPLALYAYLPLAAWRDPPANWGDPRTWQNFLDHIAGSQYRGVMFSKGPGGMLEALGTYLAEPGGRATGILRQQFPIALLPIALLGAGWLVLRRRRWGVFLLLSYGVALVYATNYDIYDVDVYYLPAHLVTAVWIAAGLLSVISLLRLVSRRRLAPDRRSRWTLLARAVAGLTPAFVLLGNWPAADRSGDRSPWIYGRAALDSLAPGALLLVGGDDTQFPLLYCRQVEGRRPDVTMVNLYSLLLPERLRLLTRLRSQGVVVNVPEHYASARRGVHDDNCLPVQLAADNVGRRPLYVLGPEVLLKADWVQGLMKPYFRLRGSNVPWIRLAGQPPGLEVPAARRSAAAFRLPAGELRLLDLRLRPRSLDGVDWVDVEYDWELSAPGISGLQVRLVFGDAEGNFVTDREGIPAFQDLRPLGGVLAAPESAGYRLPSRFTDRASLFVPQGFHNRESHAWLAVLHDGEPVPLSGAESPYFPAGRLPARGDADPPAGG